MWTFTSTGIICYLENANVLFLIFKVESLKKKTFQKILCMFLFFSLIRTFSFSNQIFKNERIYFFPQCENKTQKKCNSVSTCYSFFLWTMRLNFFETKPYIYNKREMWGQVIKEMCFIQKEITFCIRYVQIMKAH